MTEQEGFIMLFITNAYAKVIHHVSFTLFTQNISVVSDILCACCACFFVPVFLGV
ncbi:hypothetical protein K457DRAFT_140110, partial [Linnemannia elongata AG-77]